jgi:DNA-damage-inducible protein J
VAQPHRCILDQQRLTIPWCARIDERTKKEAAAVLKTIGLTVSDAFRMLLMRVAAEKAPFEPLVPNAETVAAMKAARRGEVVKAGKPGKLLRRFRGATSITHGLARRKRSDLPGRNRPLQKACLSARQGRGVYVMSDDQCYTLLRGVPSDVAPTGPVWHPGEPGTYHQDMTPQENWCMAFGRSHESLPTTDSQARCRTAGTPST